MLRPQRVTRGLAANPDVKESPVLDFLRGMRARAARPTGNARSGASCITLLGFIL
jgi:hypothetical protein